MNRIYKVIYSKARQCSIVVSEFAKSSHKNSRKGASHIGTPALARILAAALVAGAVTWGGVPEVSWAADNTTVTDEYENEVTNTDPKKDIKDINANITGKRNKVIDSSNAEIVGDSNTVTNEVKDGDKVVAPVRSDDARIVGSNNAISGSRNQQVIGDNNQIIGRDDGTVSEGEENVSDLTIGSGNFIRSKNTERNKWDSLKVIGNNNRADMEIDSAGGPAAGIVIGDNQNIDNIQDSIVIGSLSPDEQKEQVGEGKYKSDKYTVGLNSVVVGYHATSSKDASTVIGNRSKVSGNYQTVTGLRSTIEGNYYNNKGFNLRDAQSGNFASIYGSFNKIEDATGPDDMDGVGNSINGSMNVTSNARGTMIMGVGNTVTHSKGEFLVPKDDDSGISTRDLLDAGVLSASDYALGRDITGKNLTYPADQTYAAMRDAWQRYMETSGGAVSVLGNSNTSDYAIRSQILGTNNMLKGAVDTISSYNTISGFSNTGENVKRTAIVGTGNTLKNSEDNVVIGDYHNLENGKHNVILGSMASEEKAVKKTAKAAWAATDDNPDGTYTYTVNEQVALKPNTKDIENAVMVGYNTDVTQNGGVALGSDSVASTEAGETGYDALGKTHNNSDKDYSAWVSTGAAVSVGRAEEKDKEGKVTAPAITRQITNLAAGTEDTDAVNVAQLKASEKKVAVVFDDRGSLLSTDATVNHEHESGDKITNVSKGIALGNNATVYNQSGSKADAMKFGSNMYTSGIAIGENGYALEDSIDLGNKIYNGAMGDVTDLSKYNKTTSTGTGRVLIGNNSYSSGSLSTLIGNHSIMTTSYLNGAKGFLPQLYSAQNAGAVSIGALNSIESYSSSSTMSGVANDIIGLANKTRNSNGALILGAGNEINNSIAFISVSDSSTMDVATAAQQIRDVMAEGTFAGGATLAIGGGNKADYTQNSQLMGVGNSLTGTSSSISKFNMLDGYKNTATNVSNTKIIGSNNTVNDKADSNTIIGDKHVVAAEKTNNVIIGNADHELTTSASDAVLIGHNADVKVDGGVALGSGSVAVTDKGAEGYDPLKKGASESADKAWKSSWAAISVGDGTHTRQITGVAAGFADTDAVNVAQLKSVASLPVHIYSGGKGSSGSYTAGSLVATPTISSLQFDFGDGLKADEVDAEGGKRVLVSLDKNALKGDPDFKGDTGEQGPKGDKGDTGATGAQGEQGPKGDKGEKGDTGAQGEQGLKGDKGDKGDTGAPGKDGKDGGVGTVVGDDTNITVANTETDATKPANYKVSLNKAITVDKVTAGDTTISSNGVSIAGGPSMTKDGIDAAGKKITNVAAGTETTDAVNYGQLKDVESKVDSNTQNINYLNGRVGELGDRINKVGAGAAALAALHPLDYDPEDKWDFAAGVGNYRNATAAAVGLFYRPNERTMFNLGWTMGDNRNMVNGGFSLKFGKSNKYIKYSKAEMASVIDKQSREIAELKARDVQNAKDKAEMKADNAEMKAEIEALKKQVEALAAKK
ncbi:ESPR-type extended signal peptide-containing protein [uncultured Dialister sp.]|jgi:hypothetical protein|uniref:ESPR-type extended signal peptide-containing protein n=1 Tax=uncultured Dialister sp. TaxID=278064 RepID=UPI0025E4D064|nr:ESPR-type extended signal peptide-containing protein [uncultured Dialister sp.]